MGISSVGIRRSTSVCSHPSAGGPVLTMCSPACSDGARSRSSPSPLWMPPDQEVPLGREGVKAHYGLWACGYGSGR